MKALTTISAAAIAVSVAVAGATAAAAATGAPAAKRSCFYSSEWRSWSSPSSDTLYFKLNNGDVYRVGLAGRADGPSLKGPGDFLVLKARGSSSICSPLDLDLSVANTSGFKSPVLTQSLTKLSADEVAAIPKKYRP